MAPAGNGSLKIVWLLVKVAAVLPLLVTLIVQLKSFPTAVTPLTLLVFVTVRSGASVTVTVSLFDVAPSAEAEAILVMPRAATSPAVTE